MSSAITVADLTKTFDDGTVALESLDLRVAAGEFLSLIGPSGCGKSTLLRLIAGLDTPTSGTLDVARESISFVFQDAHLLPWRNVLRNVALPLELRRVHQETRLSRAAAALAAVGLAGLEQRYPAQLSGGQRMRVSLARALITEPELLLLDEPFAALDEITRQQLDDQLRDLWRSRGMTIVFVTHSILEATFLSDRAIVFSPRPGRIVLDRKLDLPTDRPATLRADANFAREMRTLYNALATVPSSVPVPSPGMPGEG